jgi:general stress protein 26
VSKMFSLEKIWAHFQDFQHVCLATVEDDHPRVRPVTLIYFEERLWITTDTKSAKVKQIKDNPNVEFCLIFKEDDMDCCLRVAGLARIISDRDTKSKIAKHCGFFSKHWTGIDDPDFTLLEISPVEVVYVTPKEVTRMKLQ